MVHLAVRVSDTSSFRKLQYCWLLVSLEQWFPTLSPRALVTQKRHFVLTLGPVYVEQHAISFSFFFNLTFCTVKWNVITLQRTIEILSKIINKTLHQLTNSPVKCVLLCFNCSLLTTVTQKSLQWKGDTGFELLSTGGKISYLIQIHITVVLCFILSQPAQFRVSSNDLFPQNIYLFPVCSLVFLNSDRR